MKVKRINLQNSQDIQKFVNFPFDLYRGIHQWIPTIKNQEEQALIPGKHPFYRHSTADFFIIESDGDTLGRIAAIHNRNHNRFRNCHTAFFGFFEVVNDIQAARLLFQAVFDWAREKDLHEVIGPRGLIGSDSGGILVEGFEHQPAFGVPYNLPYYDAFIQACGFHKDTDHLSGYLPGNYQLPERISRIADRVRKRGRYWVKSFSSKKELRQWAPHVVSVHSQAFIHNHEYFPPTSEEISLITETLIEVTDPRLIKLVMFEEKVIGFVLAYHDLSRAIQKSKGQIWPLGWYYLLRERQRSEWVNVNGIGVLPEHRGKGADTLLFDELAKSEHALGFKHIDIVQVNEANFESRSDMEAIGVQWYKRHRNYRCNSSLL